MPVSLGIGFVVRLNTTELALPAGRAKNNTRVRWRFVVHARRSGGRIPVQKCGRVRMPMIRASSVESGYRANGSIEECRLLAGSAPLRRDATT